MSNADTERIFEPALAAAVAAAEEVVEVETDVGNHILGYVMNMRETVEAAVKAYLATLNDGSMHSDCPTYYDGCHCDEAAQSDGDASDWNPPADVEGHDDIA